MKGSHKLKSIISQHKQSELETLQTRFSDNVANNLARNDKLSIQKVTGRRGTLVIFNSTGLHRGSPIVEGSRATLTAYIFPSRLKTQGLIDKFEPVLGHCKSL